MKTIRAFAAICLSSILCFQTSAATVPNIVVENMEHTFQFVPAKDGLSIEKIVETKKNVYRANRTGGHALASSYYDSFTSIDKASGGEVFYGKPENNEIFYDDTKICRIVVPIKDKDARGKSEFRITRTRPDFCTHVFLTNGYNVETGEIRFEFPVDLAERFTITERNVKPGTLTRTEETKGKQRVIVYRYKDVNDDKHFDDAPPSRMAYPHLVITGYYDDEQALYRHIMNRYIDSEDAGSASVAALAHELTDTCTSDRSKIDAITDYVHDNIRYLAIAHGDYGHRPDKPSEVLRKRYGDCKGSAALLRALMRAAGLDARYVWIGTPDVCTDWTAEPNMTSGDHMIAAVMTGDSIMYIDGTAKFIPAGLPPATLWGRETLVEDTPEHCIVDTIPVYDITLNSRRDSIVMVLKPETHSIEASGTVRFTGQRHAQLMSELESKQPNKRHVFICSQFASAVNGALKAEGTLSAGRTGSCITGTAEVSNGVAGNSDEMYVDLNPFPALASLKFDLTDRTTGGWLGTPMHFANTYRLLVPEGLAVTDAPADISVSTPWIDARISSAISADGSELTRVCDLTIKERYIPFEELENFNSQIQKLARACSSKAVVKRN